MATLTSIAPTLVARVSKTCRIVLVATLAPIGAAHAGTVKIDNFTFTPAVLTIAPGETVTWTNGDDIPHTVVAADKSYKSKPLDTNDTFAHTFPAAGEYSYFCSLHPHMTGKIVVKAR